MKLVIGFAQTSQVALEVKKPLINADVRDMSLIPGLGRSPGGGHGNPLHCAWLENPMDRGTWWAIAHRVAKSCTWWKQFSRHVGFAKLPFISGLEISFNYSLLIVWFFHQKRISPFFPYVFLHLLRWHVIFLLFLLMKFISLSWFLCVNEIMHFYFFI